MKRHFLLIDGLIFLLNVLLLYSTVTGYNLDTKYPIIFRSTPGNYFGFSVALHRNRLGPMALVGAPRANSSILNDQVHQPGVLYKCDIFSNSPCEEVVLDTKGNTLTDRGNELSYIDKKDDMWLGVSLDIQQNYGKNDIVTCGHLWKNQYYRQHYLTNGVCYVINSDLEQSSVTKLVPLVQKSKQAIIPPGIYHYAFGQVGTSAAFSEDGKSLLLGAPGFYDWAGTVVSYSADSRNRSEMYKNPIIPDPPGKTSESYIGYSVTSGKFYDSSEIFFAVGAPRDGGSHGRVYIFKALKPTMSKLFVHQKKEGTQFGEYFGAAVLGINLNNDLYSDLLVGAPFFSTESGGDEGKVYVFISNGMGLQLLTELFGNKSPGARFGTSIVNAGDLNQDGFNDVVIGAPYEAGGGSVYIYHGSRNGINPEYVQRIFAADIEPSLSGFGIQISRGLDIDANQYPDILVGAYASSNAVLFRTHPVIQLFPKLIFSPKQINSNTTTCTVAEEKLSCVNVTACLWYAGKHVPLSLELYHEIFVEHRGQANLISPRGFFIQNGERTTVVLFKSQLEVGADRCTTFELYIRPDIKDVITPIEILYRYNLIQPSYRRNAFNKSFPIIDPSSPVNITSPITFQTGCGRDDACLSDLVISASILGIPENVPLIMGETTTVTLLIEVRNEGEPAYLSELLIHLPSEMPSINQDICSTLNDQQNQQSNASLICDLGNPLEEGKEVRIQIKLDVTKIPTEKKQVNIYLEAYTASTEVNPRNNILNIPLYFKAVADISITGTPSHEQIPYDEETNGHFPVSISHTYFIMNHGPSPIQLIDVTLYVPTSIQKSGTSVNFLISTCLETDSGKPLTVPAKCNDTCLQTKPSTPEVKIQRKIFDEDELVAQTNEDNFTLNAYHTNESDIETITEKEHVSPRFKRSGKRVQSSKKRRDIVIDCTTAECMAIQCTASPFIDIRKFARIRVEALINISLLNDVLDPWYRIEFVTQGEVKIREDKSGVQSKNFYSDKTLVKTVIVHPGPPPSEEIAQWIIFVSIGAGILLLLIILILLVRFGFFKRKQKEKMAEMISGKDSKEYEALDNAENTERDDLN